MGWWVHSGSITVQPGCRTHAEPLSPALSSQHTLPCWHCALHTALHTALPMHCTLPSPFFAHTAFALHTYFSSQHTLLRLRCTAQGWVHFWWDDSNGLVVHSAEGQKRPQAGACTMGRAITHCTHCTRFTLHSAHTALQRTLKAHIAYCILHLLHTNRYCTLHIVQLSELLTHKAHILGALQSWGCSRSLGRKAEVLRGRWASSWPIGN